MGLPIWRDPEEKKASRNPAAAKADRTACLRSSIRRRPPLHDYRAAARSRLPRHATILPPRFDRPPPPSPPSPPSVASSGLRDSRRGGHVRGVPPISSLLEAAERQPQPQPSPLPPPPAPDPNSAPASRRSRIAAGMRQQLLQEDQTRARQMREHVMELRARNAELDRERHRIIQEAHEAGVDTEARLPRRTPSTVRDRSASMQTTILIDAGEPLRILRSPEPMHRRRGSSGDPDGPSARRSALPTPPLDTSGPAEEGVNPSFVDESEHDEPSESPRLGRAQPLHPLRHSWQASESPEPTIDGLGDRNRSPTPGDGWEIMRATIAPDETLPSFEDSFASVAASRSFNVSSNNTQSTEQTSVSSTSRRDASEEGNDNDSASSVDAEDLICTDEDIYSTEAFAEDMYYHEMQTPEGRERIAAHQQIRDRDGNRFALQTEPARVDIGFRLIEAALESDDGRERVLHIRQGSTENVRHVQDMLAESRRSGRALRQLHATEEAPTPRPDRYGAESHSAASETRRQVRGYLRRFAADSMPVDGPIIESPASPPPDYEPLSSHPNVNTFTSRAGPVAHPVSPPSNRSEREVSDALLSGDVQDLDSMRRVVERLAARDDVPEEWWMSMGLNVSRARVRERSRSPARDPRLFLARSERLERGESRL